MRIGHAYKIPTNRHPHISISKYGDAFFLRKGKPFISSASVHCFLLSPDNAPFPIKKQTYRKSHRICLFRLKQNIRCLSCLNFRRYHDFCRCILSLNHTHKNIDSIGTGILQTIIYTCQLRFATLR